MTPLPPSVARAWLPVALSRDVGARPLARKLAGTPIVLVRMDGAVRAFVDRCPHRNYPLSDGRLRNGLLECPYHGWGFAADGACALVPGQPVEDALELADRRLYGAKGRAKAR